MLEVGRAFILQERCGQTTARHVKISGSGLNESGNQVVLGVWPFQKLLIDVACLLWNDSWELMGNHVDRAIVFVYVCMYARQ